MICGFRCEKFIVVDLQIIAAVHQVSLKKNARSTAARITCMLRYRSVKISKSNKNTINEAFAVFAARFDYK